MPGAVESLVSCLAPLLELGVADGEDLIEDQHLAHRPECDRVGQARGHAARIVAELQVGKLLQSGEGENLVRRTAKLPQRQAHDRPQQLDVVDGIELGIPSDAKLEYRRDRRTRGQRGPLSGGYMPETILRSVLLPHPFRPIRPRLSPRRSSKLTSSSTRQSLGRARPKEVERVLTNRFPPNARDAEALGDAADLDYRRHYSSSATRDTRAR